MDPKGHIARFRKQNFSELQTPKAKIPELPYIEQELHPYNDQRKSKKYALHIWHSQASMDIKETDSLILVFVF